MSMVELERELTAWLIRCGLEAGEEAEMLGGFCHRLVEAGIPLWRVAIGAKLLHPLLDAQGCRWRRGEGCVKEDYAREEVSDVNEDWLSSPFHHLLHRLNADHLRRRLDADHRRGEFPLLDRFMDEGSTDYLALAVDLGPRPRKGTGGMLCSFQVDRPGGFVGGEIDRQPGPARLHRDRARGQRGGQDRGALPDARPAGDRLLGLRQRRRAGPAAAGVARPLRAQGRAPAGGAVHAGCRSLTAVRPTVTSLRAAAQ